MESDDNVVHFTGGTTLDIEPDRVLQAAVGQLSNVLVIGITSDDELYVAASSGDTFLNHYLASLAVQDLLDRSEY